MNDRKCGICQDDLNVKDMNLAINVKRTGFIEKIRVCGKCHHLYHTKGE